MPKTKTATEIEDLQTELEELKQMIREAETLDDLNDLHHKVGGSDREKEEWMQRNQRLDALEPKCSWGKFESQCSSEELQARRAWNLIMSQQGVYESKYC
jgi:chaperonin cofactor prefoldin